MKTTLDILVDTSRLALDSVSSRVNVIIDELSDPQNLSTNRILSLANALVTSFKLDFSPEFEDDHSFVLAMLDKYSMSLLAKNERFRRVIFFSEIKIKATDVLVHLEKVVKKRGHYEASLRLKELSDHSLDF